MYIEQAEPKSNVVCRLIIIIVQICKLKLTKHGGVSEIVCFFYKKKIKASYLLFYIDSFSYNKLFTFK